MHPKPENTEEKQKTARWLTDAVFYLAILFFAIGFNFSDRMAGNWYQQFMPNIGGRTITDITFADSLNGFAITNEVSDTSFVLRTSNGGDNWFLSHFDTGVCTYYNIQFINQNTGFVSGYLYNGSSFRIVKTTNGGVNWSYVNFPNDIVAIDMFVLNQDTIWLVDSGSLTGGVFFTSNGGASWQNQLNLGNANPDRIYMINGNVGFVSETNNYTRITTNSGQNWEVLFTGSGQGFYDMYFADNLTGWGNFFNTRKTTNGGVNWIVQPMPSGGNIVTSSIQKLSGINKDTIWGAGAQIFTSLGIRGMINRTTNGGENWLYQVPDSTYNNNIYSYLGSYNKLNGWAYLTENRGIHTTSGGDPVWLTPVNQISSEVPKGFELSQNYPNPFNPLTNIKYNVKGETSNVKLIIFDIQGKQLTELINQKQSAGTYQVDFNGSNYSSGVYFYSLIIDGKVIDTKKMILLK